MDIELLDQLEEKVDVAMAAVQELKLENALLREEAQELQKKIHSLTQDLRNAADGRGESQRLKTRCDELERRLDGVKGRIEKMVGKLKALEG
jgi:FtsZ-binding cell division protein ZapB